MKNKTTSKPKIIVLAQSKAWCSLIRRTFTNANLCWVLDADSIEEQAATLGAHVAIVEVPSANAAQLSVVLSLLANNSLNLKIFAVGESELLHWKELLRVAGVAMTCWSTLQTSSLARAMERHWENSAAVGHQRLESLVEANLPWPTAVEGPTA